MHPRNESVLLYGSYLSGMWRTNDAHAAQPTWKQVSCGEIPCGGAPNPGLPIGALAIMFDPASPGGDHVYASVPGVGIYLSTDAGVHWTVESPSPRFAHRLALAPGTMLYAAAADGVWRRPLHTDTAAHGVAWEHLAQPMGAVEFRGIDVDPFNPLHVVALTHVTSPPFGMIRSRDGGSSWTVLGTYRKDYQLGWWANKDNFGDNFTDMNFNWAMAATLQFSPHSSSQLWLGDSLNIWLLLDLNADTPIFMQQPKGHEEVFVLSMAAPTHGPALLLGTADLGGFVHQSAPALRYPDFSWFGRRWGWGSEGTGIDFTEQLNRAGDAPAALVVAQTQAWGDHSTGRVLTSPDGGKSWSVTGFNASAARAGLCPLGVAVGAWDPAAIVVMVANAPPFTSIDGGRTFAAVKGLPRMDYPFEGYSGNRYNMSRPLAAARPAARPVAGPGASFLYVDCPTGQVFESGNSSGLQFTPTGLRLPSSPRCDVTARPTPTRSVGGAASDVDERQFWIAMDREGLFFTVDAGRTAAKLPTVAVAHAVAVGAPAHPGGEPVVYIFGSVLDGPDGLPAEWRPWASLDRGHSWVDLGDESGRIGLGNWPAVLSASRRDFGVLYVGSFGSGAMTANVSDLLL